MKEFIVNKRQVCTVECDIPVNDCPVMQMLLERKIKLAGAEQSSVYIPSDDRRTVACSQTHYAANLRRTIMDLCMDCNVKAR